MSSLGSRRRHRRSDDPQPLDLGGRRFLVQPKAVKPWPYRLTCSDFDIRIGAGSGKGVPTAQVHFGQFGLATTNPAQLIEHARLCLCELGPLFERGISRVDVAVDWQGWVPALAEMSSVVCASSYRPIYPNLDAPETFYFGKRSPMIRVYNKTVETTKKRKSWWLPIFEACDGFDPAEDVWRAECEVRREHLRELGIDTCADLLAAPNAVLDWALTWAQLRVGNKNDWIEDERWSRLRSVNLEGKTLLRERRIARLLSLDALDSRLVGLVATAAAYYDEPDYWETLKRLSLSAEVYMMAEEIDFEVLRQKKARRLDLELNCEGDSCNGV